MARTQQQEFIAIANSKSILAETKPSHACSGRTTATNKTAIKGSPCFIVLDSAPAINALVDFLRKFTKKIDKKTRTPYEKFVIMPFLKITNYLKEHQESLRKGWGRTFSCNIIFLMLFFSFHALLLNSKLLPIPKKEKKKLQVMLKLIAYFSNREISRFLDVAFWVVLLGAIMACLSKLTADVFFGIKFFAITVSLLHLTLPAWQILWAKHKSDINFSFLNSQLKQTNKQRKLFIEDAKTRSLEWQEKILVDRLKNKFVRQKQHRDARDLAEVIFQTNREIKNESSYVKDILAEAQLLHDAEKADAFAAAKENAIGVLAEQSAKAAVEEITESKAFLQTAKSIVQDVIEKDKFRGMPEFPLDEKYITYLIEDLVLTYQEKGLDEKLKALENRALALPTSTELAALSEIEYDKVLSESFAIVKEKEIVERVISKIRSSLNLSQQVRRTFRESVSRIREELGQFIKYPQFFNDIFEGNSPENTKFCMATRLLQRLAFGPELSEEQSLIRRDLAYYLLQDADYVAHIEEFLKSLRLKAPKISTQIDPAIGEL